METIAVRGLLVEFEENLRQLRVERSSHADSLRASAQLLALAAPEPGPLPDIAVLAPLFMSCLTNANFEPRLGTLDSLIASGNLQLIQDPELRTRLTDWPSVAGDFVDWERIERENTEQFMLRFMFDYIAFPDLMASLESSDWSATEVGNLDDKRVMRFRESAFESDLQGLFSSLRFEGMLASRVVNLTQLVQRADELEQQALQITAQLARLQ
jgi:hypothetical protein